MKRIITGTAEFEFDLASRILTEKIIAGVEIELGNAIENYRAAQLLTGGRKYLKLVDARASASVSKEARDYSAEIKADDGRIAVALVIKSTSSRLIANFYVNFNKPKVPTRIFSSEERALEWLHSFLFLTETEMPGKRQPAFSRSII